MRERSIPIHNLNAFDTPGATGRLLSSQSDHLLALSLRRVYGRRTMNDDEEIMWLFVIFLTIVAAIMSLIVITNIR
jgi:ABC-type multidrug transport system permease subunit